MTEERAASTGSPTVRGRVAWTAALSVLLSVAMGAAITVQEPEHKSAAALAFVGALTWAALVALLRGAPAVGLLATEVAAILGFVVGVLVLLAEPMLLQFVEGLGAAVLAFMVVQVLVMVWSHEDRTATAGSGLAARVLWRMFFASLVLAAIAAATIPSFSHGPRFDSGAIDDLRAILVAETAYAAANEGLFGPLDCLVEPGRCLHGYAGPAFLDAQILAPKRYRYARTLHAGREVVRASGAHGLESFACVAVPLQPGHTYAVRSFCADDTGFIGQDEEGRVPEVQGGRCPAALKRVD
jgi:hypothetical protein